MKKKEEKGEVSKIPQARIIVYISIFSLPIAKVELKKIGFRK